MLLRLQTQQPGPRCGEIDPVEDTERCSELDDLETAQARLRGNRSGRGYCKENNRLDQIGTPDLERLEQSPGVSPDWGIDQIPGSSTLFVLPVKRGHATSRTRFRNSSKLPRPNIERL